MVYCLCSASIVKNLKNEGSWLRRLMIFMLVYPNIFTLEENWRVEMNFAGSIFVDLYIVKRSSKCAAACHNSFAGKLYKEKGPE